MNVMLGRYGEAPVVMNRFDCRSTGVPQQDAHGHLQCTHGYMYLELWSK
jgi:hypothetical protein